MSDVSGLVAQARAIADEGFMIHGLDWTVIQATLRNQADALERAEAVVEALRPFAKAAEELSPSIAEMPETGLWVPSSSVRQCNGIYVRDVLRAAEALTAYDRGSDE